MKINIKNTKWNRIKSAIHMDDALMTLTPKDIQKQAETHASKG